jgi:hypothetical protein
MGNIVKYCQISQQVICYAVFVVGTQSQLPFVKCFFKPDRRLIYVTNNSHTFGAFIDRCIPLCWHTASVRRSRSYKIYRDRIWTADLSPGTEKFSNGNSYHIRDATSTFELQTSDPRLNGED